MHMRVKLTDLTPQQWFAAQHVKSSPKDADTSVTFEGGHMLEHQAQVHHSELSRIVAALSGETVDDDPVFEAEHTLDELSLGE